MVGGLFRSKWTPQPWPRSPGLTIQAISHLLRLARSALLRPRILNDKLVASTAEAKPIIAASVGVDVMTAALVIVVCTSAHGAVFERRSVPMRSWFCGRTIQDRETCTGKEM